MAWGLWVGLGAVSAGREALATEEGARAAGRTPLVLSSASGRGVPEALRAILAEIEQGRVEEAEQAPAPAWQP